MMLQTRRLIIRPLVETDLDDFLEFKLDAQVFKFIAPPLSQAEETEQFFCRIQNWCEQKPEKLPFAVQLKATKKVIGDLVLCFDPTDVFSGEIGYVLHTQFQGCGYAYEMVSHFIPFICEQYTLRNVIARTDADNIRSITLLKKVGMDVIDVIPHNKIRDGAPVDQLVFSVSVS